MCACVCRALGVELRVLPLNALLESLAQANYCGVLLQSPTTDGELLNLEPVLKAAHAAKVRLCTHDMA